MLATEVEKRGGRIVEAVFSVKDKGRSIVGRRLSVDGIISCIIYRAFSSLSLRGCPPRFILCHFGKRSFEIP